MTTRFLRDQRGASATEFAVVLIPMTVILIVIIQFGWILFLHNDMFNAARDSARRWAGNTFSQSMIPDLTAAPTVTNGAVLCSAPLLANGIEDVACKILSTYGNMEFSVLTSVTRGPGVEDCEQLSVVVTTPMADASFMNIFGVFDGKTLTADAVLLAQYDIVNDTGALVAGNLDCAGWIPP